MTKTLIFTDMDATLLDHYTYSFEAAKTTLGMLKSKKIPVIPTTSKTYAEMQPLMERIGLKGPFIVENGAAIYIPSSCLENNSNRTIDENGFWCHQFIAGKDHWIGLLSQLKNQYAGQYKQFSKMSISEIQDCTGLDAESASLAVQREFGEPVLWLGNDAKKAKFIDAIKDKGASVLEGGRFIHVSGECDKGKALKWLANKYKNQYKTDTKTIALGDSNNDIAMLEAADVAVRILSPANPPPYVNKDKVYTSTLMGPEGWSEMLTQLLS
ncbi:HAD-IIB family hydrolase [Psychrobacter sp.]|uniref:HAD-IIB family hydrolase n=1 Tax=Psychrobacter sp. TaxID=56811 RepID=UPI0025E74283|nr:HAD-IIB family hydrolase [Psychrobacter sp.]